ncbi:MAG: hypothetical protein FJ118_08490 [Deltaproteobacteria bacterium]|nr:hypothetical protein [Deltaproteobacteria bacterium]
MLSVRNSGIVTLALVLTLIAASSAPAGQVWTKCDITCRCLSNDQIGNFSFMIPVDTSPDVAFSAHEACKSYGQRICWDGCNGLKFAFTYQVTSP